VGEDLADHRGVLNAGNHPHRPATGAAGLDVDVEDPSQPLRLPVIAPRRSASLRGSFSGGRSARLPRRVGVTCSRA
jgi:hypothetical protein